MVTIVIPTYNRAGLIEKTLDSVLAQTYPDWECLVVDDFSTDNTKEIVQAYYNKDNRFHYYKNENKKGAQGARNTGIKHSQYKWIQFFDSDNIMHENLLESMFCLMSEDNAQSDVYTCFSNVIDVNSHQIIGSFKWVCEGDIRKQLLCGETYVDFNGPIIRKQKIFEIGWLDENCPSMQEWDTHIRLSKVAKYHTNPQILVDYYVGGKDTISIDIKRDVIGRVYLFDKHKTDWSIYIPGYWTYGEQTINILNDINDISFRTEYICKVYKLMPGLRQQLYIKKIKKQYKTIRHKMAKAIKKILSL